MCVHIYVAPRLEIERLRIERLRIERPRIEFYNIDQGSNDQGSNSPGVDWPGVERPGVDHGQGSTMARDRMIFSSNFGEFQRGNFSGKIFTALVPTYSYQASFWG
jgi:hypothetical protein